MLRLGQTAEEFLSELLGEMDARLAFAEQLFTADLYDNATEQQQILMTAPRDEVREMKRLVVALDVALADLAERPLPVRDEERG